MAVFFHKFHLNLVLVIHKILFFIHTRLCSVKVSVSVYPNRQMALVVIRLQLAHVGRFIQLKVADPLVIGRILVEHMRSDLLVILHLEAHVLHRFCFLNRVILDKDVVVEPVIAMQECHESGNLGTVADVIRRVTVSCSAADCS